MNGDLVFDKAPVLCEKIGGMVCTECCHFTRRRYMYLVLLSRTYFGKFGSLIDWHLFLSPNVPDAPRLRSDHKLD